jgi:hypothetical protein
MAVITELGDLNHHFFDSLPNLSNGSRLGNVWGYLRNNMWVGG